MHSLKNIYYSINLKVSLRKDLKIVFFILKKVPVQTETDEETVELDS